MSNDWLSSVIAGSFTILGIILAGWFANRWQEKRIFTKTKENLIRETSKLMLSIGSLSDIWEDWIIADNLEDKEIESIRRKLLNSCSELKISLDILKNKILIQLKPNHSDIIKIDKIFDGWAKLTGLIIHNVVSTQTKDKSDISNEIRELIENLYTIMNIIMNSRRNRGFGKKRQK